MTYRLSDFGSYSVGGRLHAVTEGEASRIAVTRDVTLAFDPRGTYAVEHGYVQYFVPEARNNRPPVVLLHGGGMSGATWESTPDGRPGWLHGLLLHGYEVHVLDNVERGRAGFAPGLWNGDPILRSLEDAWTLFRFGSAEGFPRRRAHDRQRFPIDHLESFARGFVPRWLSTTQLQAAVVKALLDRLGSAILFCHSQGAETVFEALAQGASIEALVVIEPSCELPPMLNQWPTRTVFLLGDFLDQDAFWVARRHSWEGMARQLVHAGYQVSWLESCDALPPGHSHFPMMDVGSDDCLTACLATLEQGRGNPP